MRMQPLAASQLIWLRWKESMKIQDEDRSLMIIIIIIMVSNIVITIIVIIIIIIMIRGNKIQILLHIAKG